MVVLEPGLCLESCEFWSSYMMCHVLCSVCLHVCGGHGSTSAVFPLSYSTLYSRQVLLLNLGLPASGLPGQQVLSTGLSVLLSAGVTDCHVQIFFFFFFNVGAGDPNLSSPAWAAIILSTESSPQSQTAFLNKILKCRAGDL